MTIAKFQKLQKFKCRVDVYYNLVDMSKICNLQTRA